MVDFHFMLARDRSEHSRSAETYLHTLLTPGEDRVLIVHVVEPVPSFYAGESIDPHSVTGALMKRGEQIVSESAHRLARAGFEVNTVVEQGPAGPTLCQLASKHDVDGIVMGRQGRGAVQELLLGSVSQYVVHHASCPVTLVPLPED